MDSSISASAAASRTVCLTCGDKGDVKLLIYCSQCRDSAVHHYCQEKISADDDNTNWICWDCTPKVAKVEQFRKSERISERKIHAFDVRAEWRRKLYRCKVKALRLDEARHDTSGAVQSPTAHSPFHVLQKEKLSFIDTKKHKDIGEECADVCYSEQQIESVKAGNTPLVGKRQEAYCSTLNIEEGGMVERAQVRGDSSVQDSKSAQSLGEIGNQQEMRKSRRKFVVLDDGGDFEGEGGAIGGNFSSSFPGEQNFPVDTLYSDPQVESANCLSAQPVIDPIWRGCFIFNTESESSINILAHLSNKACEKASMAANRLPVKLDVKLVSKNDVWPRSFLRLQPTDCSIALYLFPELEEDENSYDALLEDVIDNDLAMSATIDDLELLIFSSRVLPQKHWRLRRKYYLWGVFKHKSPSRSRIPTSSGLQNAATSDLPNEVEGADTGSSQDQSFPSPLSILKDVNSGSPPGHLPSPLSILKDVNSGSPPGHLPSPLSSCCNSTSTKDSPCHHERVDSIKG
uniref:Putative ovule protein n=1 Tax=Solanum chacoense TaxID=4108 RepID=A0A0V0IBH1_SOLCH